MGAGIRVRQLLTRGEILMEEGTVLLLLLLQVRDTRGRNRRAPLRHHRYSGHGEGSRRILTHLMRGLLLLRGMLMLLLGLLLLHAVLRRRRRRKLEIRRESLPCLGKGLRMCLLDPGFRDREGTS